jgi:hypothetical protein
LVMQVYQSRRKGLSSNDKVLHKMAVESIVYSCKPEERVKLRLGMLEQVKADLKSNALTDWGVCNDNSEGYCFAETDEKTLHATILKWMPYVSFDIKAVLTVDQVMANIKQVASAAKK